MAQLSLSVSGRKYDIKMEERLLHSLAECVAEDLSPDGDNDVKRLIYAYLKRCNRERELCGEMQAILERIERAAL